jgi:hypothetical protein
MLFFIITQEISFGMCGKTRRIQQRTAEVTKAPWGFRHLSSYVKKSTNPVFVQGFTVMLDRTADNKTISAFWKLLESRSIAPYYVKIRKS